MSEERLERALQEMKEEDVDARDRRGRARARLGRGDERRRLQLRGVPAGVPCLPGRSARWQPTGPHGGPPEPLPGVPRPGRGDEGRTEGDRHAAALLPPLGAMGKPGRGSRTALRGRLCRTRRHRRHDGSRRSACHGRLRRRRPVPPPRGSSRSRRLNRRRRVGSHRPGGSRRVATRRRVDRGCQRANGAVRDRRLERPGDSPPARRRHRPGRQAAARSPARSDPRFDRLGERNRLRGFRRHGWIGRLGRGGVRRGEPARQRSSPQPRRAGRIQSGAGDVGRGSRCLEPLGGRGTWRFSPR